MENDTPDDSEIQSRITECLKRAAKICCDEKQAPVIREVTRAYLYTLCIERVRFLKAAFQYLRVSDVELPESGRCSFMELIIHPPARWEFEHVNILAQ